MSFRQYFMGIFLLLFLVSCGFQLRGNSQPIDGKLFIESSNAGLMAFSLQNWLADTGYQVAEQADEADLILSLRDEIFERRVLSVSALTGKQEEIELNYRVTLSARTVPCVDASDTEETQSEEELAVAEVLLPALTLSLLRDYSYDANAVLATTEEEKTLQEDMLRDALAQIIRRLNAVAKDWEGPVVCEA